ncbi:polysaccharide pyruvyl transferase family protein [Winogradskyella aurantiaca]|uniref:polysaccharide pyruvyl transferase family protein n=1 Tax=Winogradskyella aurantiaca TaxID=2219558 RepID=UPI001E4CCBC6|nr:polysaccharide pyruvyl transferase family protein [Winogradskyella aurantiaca]
MIFGGNRIRVFWWSETKLMGKSLDNYGDIIGPYLVEKLSGKKVVFVRPTNSGIFDLQQPIYLTVGSILAHATAKCIVWGSGIISSDQKVKSAKFLAVRGPKTRESLIDQGYQVPKVYGDPALLLPLFFRPKVQKKYSLGIIPHYVDYHKVKKTLSKNPEIKVIDLMTNDVEETTKSIMECERVISSSLHGLIVSHAYEIPAAWMKFSDKLFGDGVKFVDYFASVGLRGTLVGDFQNSFDLMDLKDISPNHFTLPEKLVLGQLQKGLLISCPFNYSNITIKDEEIS